jgi:hypothetical protein
MTAGSRHFHIIVFDAYIKEPFVSKSVLLYKKYFEQN